MFFYMVAPYLSVGDLNRLARAMRLKCSEEERAYIFRTYMSGKLSLAENVRMAVPKLPVDRFKALVARDVQSAIDRFNVSPVHHDCIRVFDELIRDSVDDITYDARFRLEILHMLLFNAKGEPLGREFLIEELIMPVCGGLGVHSAVSASARSSRPGPLLTHYLRKIRLIYNGSRFTVRADDLFNLMTGDPPRNAAWIQSP
jgi:hypothetical protein